MPGKPIFRTIPVAALAVLSAGAHAAVPNRYLTSSPSSLDFASVVVGSGKTLRVSLTNTGTIRVYIASVSASGPGFSVGGISTRVIPAGMSIDLEVTFQAAQPGAATGNLQVVSNASNSPTDIPLSGTGVTAYLTPAPSSLDFGSVRVGGSAQQTVFLNNTGTGAVTVSQATVTGTGYSISGLSLPLVLAAGQSTGMSVLFAPQTAGTYKGNVAVVSTAVDSPANIPLSGATASSVSLTWTASGSPNVIGYNVLRGTTSGGPYTSLTASPVAATSYTDTTVQGGQTYYYVTTAVDADYNQSVYSNEAQAVVAGP